MGVNLVGDTAHFDGDFLDWFRQRTETSWASLPVRTPEEVLAEFVKDRVGGCDWQHGTRWLGGLGDAEVAEAERRYHLEFPPDYRLFLQRLHTVDRPMLCARYLAGDEESQEPALATARVPPDGSPMALLESPSFYSWLADGETALSERFARLWEGLQFDVEYNDLWRPSWGYRPETVPARAQRVRELVEAAPRLIPIFGHRYLLAEPCTAGNPILSVYQSDIIVYGADLRSYLLADFAGLLGLGLDRSDIAPVQRSVRAEIGRRYPEFQDIPFWGEFL